MGEPVSPRQVKVVRSLAQLREVVRGWRGAGDRVGLVPTMGALHEGHLSLVRLAKAKSGRTVVSIFVNPTQFAPHEDFTRYPRDEAGDRAKLASVDCDLVWAPDLAEMYPTGHATSVVPKGAAEGLESAHRPSFFVGVATVCTKLFTQVAPDLAVFGEKDYQQLCVIRQVVRDLDLPIEIVGHPTVRESDGLAMSSRNAYLTGEERALAPLIHQVLLETAASVLDGVRIQEATRRGRDRLAAAGFRVDYLELREAGTLAPVEDESKRPLRALVAAWLGKTRLIDNIAVS
ncbi:MAG: pantoate--beta-alanine ligase [Hyphomicrobiaceae bacterium]|nr:pantoate--beta-alanine ligase [Hyphomicrobiaceae bacterium]